MTKERKLAIEIILRFLKEKKKLYKCVDIFIIFIIIMDNNEPFLFVFAIHFALPSTLTTSCNAVG